MFEAFHWGLWLAREPAACHTSLRNVAATGQGTRRGYRNNVFIKDHLTLERNHGVFCVAKTARNQAIRVHNSDIKDFHRGVWHLWKKKKQKNIHSQSDSRKERNKDLHKLQYYNVEYKVERKKAARAWQKKCCWRLVNIISSRRQTWTMPVSLFCQ